MLFGVVMHSRRLCAGLWTVCSDAWDGRVWATLVTAELCLGCAKCKNARLTLGTKCFKQL